MLLDEGDQVSCIHELTKLAQALSHVEHHKSAEQWSIELHHTLFGCNAELPDGPIPRVALSSLLRV